MIAQLNNNFDLQIISRPDSINIVEQLIDKIRDQNNIAENDYANMLVAITEAVTNAILHGNSSDPQKKVKIKCELKPEGLVVFTVSDEGNGFNYYNLPDPTAPENLEKACGRGIFLMKHLADQVIFSELGNEVELQFKLKL